MLPSERTWSAEKMTQFVITEYFKIMQQLWLWVFAVVPCKHHSWGFWTQHYRQSPSFWCRLQYFSVVVFGNVVVASSVYYNSCGLLLQVLNVVFSSTKCPLRGKEPIKRISSVQIRRIFWQRIHQNSIFSTSIIFTKRKQLGLKLHRMYWIIGRKAELSLEDKLLIYKTILKPIVIPTSKYYNDFKIKSSGQSSTLHSMYRTHFYTQIYKYPQLKQK